MKISQRRYWRISISDEGGRYDSLSSEQLDSYQKELSRRKEKAEAELEMMHALRNTPEIVDFHEHRFVDWQEEDRFGCDLLIRMDYLNCLTASDGQITASVADAVQIGVSVCNALSACHDHSRRIIHRDVKPANIFKKGENWYQLGDFGIARTLDNSQFASTVACTQAYAAPEILKGEKYTELVDIYSLGLTLYEICNDGCLPFAESRYANQSSIEKRITEKSLPAPQNADERLSGIILKACAYNPKDRWQSAQAMKEALLDPYTTRLSQTKNVKKRPHRGIIAASIVALLCFVIAAHIGSEQLHTSDSFDELPIVIAIPSPATDKDNKSLETLESDEQETANETVFPIGLGNETSTSDTNGGENQELDEMESKEDFSQNEPMPELETPAVPAESKVDPTPQIASEPIEVSLVILNTSELSLNNGGTSTLSASVMPQDADDRTVTWQSSDSSVVSVNDGFLIAVGDGTAIITASAGGKNAKCTVNVRTVWSDWMDALPTGISSQSERRTVYRYTDYRKETMTSDSSTPPSGYTLDYSEKVEIEIPEQVVDVEEHYEYRYGCWVGADGGHSYCNVMAEHYYGGPAKIEYTDWSSTQYVNTGTMWTCGSGDKGKHKHDGTGGFIASDTGNRVWYLYSPSGSTKTVSSYFWEESRWVETSYKMLYKTGTKTVYHYYILALDYESSWAVDRPQSRENRVVEEKNQYRYMITS